MKTEPHARRPGAIVAGLVLATATLLATPRATAADNDVVGEVTPTTRFSFSAEGIPVRQALALFARANKLNIVPDLDVAGDVTVEFNDLPLDLAMRALLDANGYYFVKDGDLIRVRNRETRLFHVDYINTTRAGQGTSAVQISSSGGSSSGSSSSNSSSAGSSSGSSGDQGSAMTVTATSTIDFWHDLNEQVRTLLSESGSVTINSLAGTVLVSDQHRHVDEVARYLESITTSVLRQVDLEVEIYEIAFSNSQQLGVNWTWVSDYLYKATFTSTPGVAGTAGSGAQPLSDAGGLIIQTPVYGPAVPAAGARASYSHAGISAVFDALKQQGDLKVVSKPRLRTLNNQPAVVRVGQDLPIFLQEAIVSPGTPPVTTITESIQTVTVGTVLSITPQVSAEGLITLDVSPAVSRLVRIDTSASGRTNAPVIDIRQASSIVRLRDGDTIVMGGLVQDSAASTRRKVPILGDIPWVGRIFAADYNFKERTELIFFLTPRVVRNDRPEPPPDRP